MKALQFAGGNPPIRLGERVFALSGLLLRDPVVAVPDMIEVILVALVWDVLLTPFVLPPVMALFGRMQSARVAFS